MFGDQSVTAVNAHSEPVAVSGFTETQVNACSLLSTAAVSELTGYPANPGSRHYSCYESNGSYPSTCVWELERENSGSNSATPLGGRSFVILNVMQRPSTNFSASFSRRSRQRRNFERSIFAGSWRRRT